MTRNRKLADKEKESVDKEKESEDKEKKNSVVAKKEKKEEPAAELSWDDWLVQPEIFERLQYMAFFTSILMMILIAFTKAFFPEIMPPEPPKRM